MAKLQAAAVAAGYSTPVIRHQRANAASGSYVDIHYAEILDLGTRLQMAEQTVISVTALDCQAR